MKFGVVQFPGSNCDADAFHAVGAIVRQPVEFIWHQSEDLAGCDAVILPGGFAFGDYLRTGAIARFSPVMKAVERFARGGGLVLGICNGFQILLEAGLLPGAMMRNQGLRFLCRQVHVRVEATDTPFTCAATPGTSAGNSHRAHGRKLFLRAGGFGGIGTQQPDHFSLCAGGWRRSGRAGPRGESEWVIACDRGDLQSRAECAGFDAASGARGGGFAGIGGWVGDFPVAGR